jgi:hypothetical protein
LSVTPANGIDQLKEIVNYVKKNYKYILKENNRLKLHLRYGKTPES